MSVPEPQITLEHAAIWTSDLERLRRFYETYFGGTAGTKYTNPSNGFSSYFLRFAGGARLELMHRADIPPTRDDPPPSSPDSSTSPSTSAPRRPSTR